MHRVEWGVNGLEHRWTDAQSTPRTGLRCNALARVPDPVILAVIAGSRGVRLLTWAHIPLNRATMSAGGLTGSTAQVTIGERTYQW